MWGKSNKVWIKYQRDVLATDVYSAVFLSAFLRHSEIQKLYSWQMEVIDLQRYKLIKKPSRIQRVVKSREREPFIFIIGKN